MPPKNKNGHADLMKVLAGSAATAGLIYTVKEALKKKNNYAKLAKQVRETSGKSQPKTGSSQPKTPALTDSSNNYEILKKIKKDSPKSASQLNTDLTRLGDFSEMKSITESMEKKIDDMADVFNKQKQQREREKQEKKTVGKIQQPVQTLVAKGANIEAREDSETRWRGQRKRNERRLRNYWLSTRTLMRQPKIRRTR